MNRVFTVYAKGAARVSMEQNLSHFLAKINFAKGSENDAEFRETKAKYSTITRKIATTKNQ